MPCTIPVSAAGVTSELPAASACEGSPAPPPSAPTGKGSRSDPDSSSRASFSASSAAQLGPYKSSIVARHKSASSFVVRPCSSPFFLEGLVPLVRRHTCQSLKPNSSGAGTLPDAMASDNDISLPDTSSALPAATAMAPLNQQQIGKLRSRSSPQLRSTWSRSAGMRTFLHVGSSARALQARCKLNATAMQP